MLVEPEDRLPGTTSKPGYEKILKTCEITKNYSEKSLAAFTLYKNGLDYDRFGLKYVWIDTCCIDKSSSAELSEAINSMFNYYREADVCFAYLSDMTSEPWTFQASRWFTRGWTLQELIAPRKIHFYDGSWIYRGNRDDFGKLISAITKISRFETVFDVPVAVRMSWAANRKTTRVEDLAYCLMGIFDVNMPLLYGEGQKAFVRLQEEIIKNNPDLSIFAWSNSSSPKFSGLLAQTPDWFIGCHDLQAAPSIDIAYREFTVTNQGIRFRFPFQYHKPTNCLVLPLGHESQQHQGRLGVFLRQIADGHCVRAAPDILANEQAGPSSDEMTVQVSKVLSFPEILLILENVIMLENPDQLRRKGIIIGDVVPRGCWDPTRRTIYAGHKGVSECLLVLRINEQSLRNQGKSLGITLRYDGGRRSYQRWMYRIVEPDEFALSVDGSKRYDLTYIRRSCDRTGHQWYHLDGENTILDGIFVKGLVGMQQLSLQGGIHRVMGRPNEMLKFDWKAVSGPPECTLEDNQGVVV
jgi:hypothetical protein